MKQLASYFGFQGDHSARGVWVMVGVLGVTFALFAASPVWAPIVLASVGAVVAVCTYFRDDDARTLIGLLPIVVAAGWAVGHAPRTSPTAVTDWSTGAVWGGAAATAMWVLSAYATDRRARREDAAPRS